MGSLNSELVRKQRLPLPSDRAEAKETAISDLIDPPVLQAVMLLVADSRVWGQPDTLR